MSKKNKENVLLIVEDDKSLLRALSDKFTYEGFDVLTAENGKEGLDTALGKKPAIIILDILMPVMDGMEMLKNLRKDKWGKGVFVIILTNREPEGDLLSEAKRKPYVSIYIMKSDFKLSEVVDIAKEKLIEKRKLV